MNNIEDGVPTHRVRLRNTVRFEVTEEQRKVVTLEFFVEKIVRGLFEVDQESVFCLQDVPSKERQRTYAEMVRGGSAAVDEEAAPTSGRDGRSVGETATKGGSALGEAHAGAVEEEMSAEVDSGKGARKGSVPGSLAASALIPEQPVSAEAPVRPPLRDLVTAPVGASVPVVPVFLVSPEAIPGPSSAGLSSVQRFRRAADVLREKQAGADDAPVETPELISKEKVSEGALSASAEEVAGHASGDVDTPTLWGDSDPPEGSSGMDWARVTGRKRASVEMENPHKFFKTGLQVSLTNRYKALSDASGASQSGGESDIDLAGGSPSVELEWDMEGFEQVIGMAPGPSGERGVGEEGGK
ncbi:uncharacterized protein LOC118218430 [Anguilla anguilla]|nr:uncharacterized protein LOC118218430 [Anguilla anguilla]